jgi:hypothetical protein
VIELCGYFNTNRPLDVWAKTVLPKLLRTKAHFHCGHQIYQINDMIAHDECAAAKENASLSILKKPILGRHIQFH